jgi:hypothetical protein
VPFLALSSAVLTAQDGMNKPFGLPQRRILWADFHNAVEICIGGNAAVSQPAVTVQACPRKWGLAGSLVMTSAPRSASWLAAVSLINISFVAATRHASGLGCHIGEPSTVRGTTCLSICLPCAKENCLRFRTCAHPAGGGLGKRQAKNA